MDITIQYQIDRAQWQRVLAYVLRPQLRISRIGGVVCAVVGLLLVAVSVLLGMAFGTVTVASVALILGLVVFFGTQPLAVAIALRQQADIIYLPTTATVTDEAIRFESSAANGEYRWSAVDGIDDLTDMWLVRVGKALAMPVPKAAFDETDRDTFSKFASSFAGASPQA